MLYNPGSLSTYLLGMYVVSLLLTRTEHRKNCMLVKHAVQVLYGLAIESVIDMANGQCVVVKW